MELSLLTLPLFLLAGGLAGFVNTVAGGGSFFSFPLLILLGFPPHLANGTIRVTVLLQNLVSVPTYAHQGYFRPRAALALSAVAVPAAIVGAWSAVSLGPEPYRKLSAALILLFLATLFVSPKAWTRAASAERIRWEWALPLMAVVGFYGGFFQIAVGMLFLAALVLGGGWDLVTANSLKVTVVLVYTIAALAIFSRSGHVDWTAGVALGAGNMVGAWVGARMAVKKGPEWIRWVLVIMGLLAAGKLLFG